MEFGPDVEWFTEEPARSVTAKFEAVHAAAEGDDAPEGLAVPQTDVNLRALLVAAPFEVIGGLRSLSISLGS